MGSVDALVTLIDKADESAEVEDAELHKKTNELFSAARKESAPTYLALLEKLLSTADAFFDTSLEHEKKNTYAKFGDITSKKACL